MSISYYHERSKHSLFKFAVSLGYLDWKNQPNPFRFYKDTKIIKLPFLEKDPNLDYDGLYIRKNNPCDFSLSNIGGMLELSMGLSAWKEHLGSKWSLRMNPSSGNLHPTETHLILLQDKPGIYHYSPYLHALEKRGELSEEIAGEIMKLFETPGFFIALSSIYWREAWKYGERAFRYCHHDVGHALAGISLASNLFGWKVTYLSELSDKEVEEMLGFNKVKWHDNEKEYLDVLCYVSVKNIKQYDIPEKIQEQFMRLLVSKEINQLSDERIKWDIIDDAVIWSEKPKTRYNGIGFFDIPLNKGPKVNAAKIIRQRRSAQNYNREKSVMNKDQLLDILDKTIPRKNISPFDVGIESEINLVLYIHNVKGIPQGLYYYKRFGEIPRKYFKESFLWQEVFPRLFLLEKGNYRDFACMVSCHQEIGSESCFVVSMIGEALVNDKGYLYKQRHWESGMIGQVLYLGAEAHGLRGTGIGCFFDDEVFKILDIKNNKFQNIYHFTIGSPYTDIRLTTLDPYSHLKNDERVP